MGVATLKVVFKEEPEEIKTQAESPEAVGLKEMLAMNRERIVRDKCLVSTSSDNMHHV